MKAKGLALLFTGASVPTYEMERLINELVKEEISTVRVEETTRIMEFVEWLFSDGYFFLMGHYKGVLTFGSLRDGFNDYRKYYLYDTYRYWLANVNNK